MGRHWRAQVSAPAPEVGRERGTRYSVKTRAGAWLRGWSPFLVISAIAVVTTAIAGGPSPAPPADTSLKREAFRAIASDEARMRAEASKVFPTDLWSRDDDFHQRERKRAVEWAGAHHARMEDVLAAIDDGLRSKWPQDSNSEPSATTPPCRPRAIY